MEKWGSGNGLKGDFFSSRGKETWEEVQGGVWGGGEQHHRYPRRTAVAFGTGNLRSGVKSTPMGIETQFCQLLPDEDMGCCC